MNMQARKTPTRDLYLRYNEPYPKIFLSQLSRVQSAPLFPGQRVDRSMAPSIIDSLRSRANSGQEEEPLDLPVEAIYSERNGRHSGGFSCCQELAYEIIVRETHERIRDQHGLLDCQYNGDAFTCISQDFNSLARALHALKEAISQFNKPKQVLRNSGTAEDLNGVKMNKKINFLGKPECVICGDLIRSGQRVRRTPCLHLFHLDCLQPWLLIKQVCPIDKMPI